MAIETFGSTLIRPILAFLWKDSRINPTAASRGAVCFECGESWNHFAVRHLITVDFPQNFFGGRLAMLTFDRIVPFERQECRMPRLRIAPRFFLEQHAEMIRKPVFAAAIPGRFNRLL